MGLTTALAIAGTAAGLYSSSQQTKAASNAAMGQNRATDQSVALQREATDRAIGTLSPYSQRGNRANAFMDAFLYGDGSYAEDPIVTSASPTSSQSLDQILQEQNPGAWSVWRGWEAKLKPSSYTKGHRAQFGDFAGYLRATDPNAIQRAEQSLQTKAAEAKANETKVTRSEAQGAYEASPWAKMATDYEEKVNPLVDQYETDMWNPLGGKGRSYEDSKWSDMSERATKNANDEFLNIAGASGSALSGRTARGLQENRANIDDAFYTDYVNANQGTTGKVFSARDGALTDVTNKKAGAFTNFWNSLTGQSDTGYSADKGIVSAGQDFASVAGQGLVDQAQVSGQAGMNAAANSADMLNNGMSWAGWLYGQKKPVGGASSKNNRVVDPTSIRVLPR